MNYDDDNKHKYRSMSYFWIFAALIAFWPAGIFLLLLKLGLFDSIVDAIGNYLGNPSRQDMSQQSNRFLKYRTLCSGRNIESIEYLANVVGISYESALRDLQKMVRDGEFGTDAYINYIDKTIILDSTKPFSPTDVHRVDTSKFVANEKPAKTNTKKPKAEKFKPFGSIPTWLGLIGVVFLIYGIAEFGASIKALIYGGSLPYFIHLLLRSLFGAGCGVLSFLGRKSYKTRTNRMKAYLAAITGHDCISLEELRSVTGVKQKTLQSDLETMISKGLLGDAAYIDQGDQLLILKPGAKPKAEKTPAPAPVNTNDDNDEAHYRAILSEIREVNDAIPDPEISARIYEIESLTSKIFNAVQEKPEKLPQIKSFMSYYLPTTLKLLHSYADFDKSGADGDNIRAAKADIERILDTLVDGFKKQLDKLYETDAIDISSDINVLENMLRRDGLSGDGSDFGVMGGH